MEKLKRLMSRQQLEIKWSQECRRPSGGVQEGDRWSWHQHWVTRTPFPRKKHQGGGDRRKALHRGGLGTC